jgi:enterochelin esterase-like enzyme
MSISRRAVLLGGLGLAVAGCSSSLPDGVPGISPGKLVNGSFRSSRRHTTVGWSVSYPPGHNGARLPVLVFLHPRGGDHTGAFGGRLHLDRFLAQAVQHGTRPFAIASADGGDHEYWHPRSGTDPAGMIVDEFLPLLAAHGLEVGTIGLMGASMGGYGALYLAKTLDASRVAVAVAESPAIWHHGYQSVAGAFDNAEDWSAHTIWGGRQRFAGIAMRVDCGAGDGFAPVVRDLRTSMRPTPAGGIEPGKHDSAYWRSQAASQLRFVGTHLA